MFPVLRQRLLLVAGVVLGGLVWLLVLPYLSAADGSGGVVLLDARVGVVLGIVLTVVGGLVAMGLACGAVAMGNPLAGPFVVAGALVFPAAAGGGVGGYLRRHGFAVSGYDWLMVEAMLWLAMWVGVLGLLFRARRWLRPRLPRAMRMTHLVTPGTVGLDEARLQREDVYAAGVACVVGYLVCAVAVRTPAVGQAVAGVTLASGVGSAVGLSLFRTARPWLTLLSPMVVSLAAAGYLRMRVGSPLAVEAAFNVLALPGATMAVPIYFASAGVAGAVLGAALAQSLAAGGE